MLIKIFMTFLKKGAGVEIKHHITYSREEIEFEWPLKRKWKSHGLGINKKITIWAIRPQLGKQA